MRLWLPWQRLKPPRRPTHDRPYYRMVGPQCAAGSVCHRLYRRGRPVVATHAADRRHSGPFGCAGDRADRIPGASTAGRRGSGHLSPDLGHADCAAIKGRAGVLVLRDLLCLRHLRGWRGPLLGAVPRAGIPQRRRSTFAGWSDARAWAGCDGRGLGLSIRAEGREPEPGRATVIARLGDALCHQRCRWRVGSRKCRRVCEAILDHRGSGADAGAWHHPVRDRRGSCGQQHGHRRAHGRAVGIRVHGAGARLSGRHR